MKILEKIKALQVKNPSEQALADFILKDPYPILYMSDKELSKQVFVSTSSIYRFCRTLGIKGFMQFKVMLAQELNANKHRSQCVDFNFPFQKSSNLSSIMQNMGNVYKETIEDTLTILDEKEIMNFVYHIKHARRLYMFTTNMNVQIAQNFAIKLREIKEDIQISTHPLSQRLQANAMKKGDVLIALTYAGNSLDLLDIVQIAKQNNATILLVSSLHDKRFYPFANERLLLSSKEDPLHHKISSFSSHISAQFIFDIIFSMIYQINYEKNLGQLAKVYGMENTDDPSTPAI